MHDNDMTHRTHNVATEADRLRHEQPRDFGDGKAARKLAKSYETQPDVAQFWRDMADYLDGNTTRHTN